MTKVELEIVALSHSVAQTSNYAVILGEAHGARRLPVIIGAFEAQAIAVAMERMIPKRPLTHDLFRNTLEIFNIGLKEIIINDLDEGIFYAQLVCDYDGEVFEIDSRTSDALALAVRFGCPIYTYEFVLEAAGVVLEAIEEDEEDVVPARPSSPAPRDSSLNKYSLDQLKEKLREVLEKENYEEAARIRDEINRRKS